MTVWRDWRARREWLPLVVMALAAAGVWIFIAVADEVMEGETHHLDELLILALRNPADPGDPLGPRWVEEMARDVTALGSMTVLTFLTVAVSGFLALAGRGRTALLLLASVGGGVVLSTLLKHGFARPRPDLVPHGAEVYTASFPSGHSMLSAVTYLTLGALLARVQARRRLKAYLLALSVFLMVAVGVSRVYLGVHWPTDVLAGWAIGAAWAQTVWLVAWWMQRRGRVEPAPPPEDNGESP
ncbi:MAG TPA: phosphatase PAP2 family protein [Azospirillaceae bacterium]|nr:phosphatase PAP2 family protein [Azospirillaceae bacterium]